MNLPTFIHDIFTRTPASPPARSIAAAPRGVAWRTVRPRTAGAPVRAWLATTSGQTGKKGAKLQYTAGEHMMVEHAPDDVVPVRRDIFDRTYQRNTEGLFEKRTGVHFRYFTLPNPVTVQTLEGDRRANAGDWIMEGTAGELWPIPPAQAARAYVAASVGPT